MIRISDIEREQKSWAEGLVAISQAYRQGGDYIEMAHRFIKDHYAYEEGTVLFKPTKASAKQFRLEEEDALSYFVAHNERHPEDQGFALQAFEGVRFENEGMILEKHYAAAMGNYFFKMENGEELKVEYTFLYNISDDERLKIKVHHSSVPFSPEQNDQL